MQVKLSDVVTHAGVSVTTAAPTSDIGSTNP